MLKLLLNNTLTQNSTAAPATSLYAKSGKLQSKQWIIDSEASDHMTRDGTLFFDYQSCHSHLTVKIVDGTLSKVTGIESIQKSLGINLKSMFYVPNLDCNLIFISKLTRDNHCLTTFFPNVRGFWILSSKRKSGTAEMCNRLYLLKPPESRQALVAATSYLLLFQISLMLVLVSIRIVRS
ncbi:hypothetical protein V6Z11_D06G129500 [Gossypium hirsutum]